MIHVRHLFLHCFEPDQKRKHNDQGQPAGTATLCLSMSTTGRAALVVWLLLCPHLRAAQSDDPVAVAKQARAALASRQYDRAAALYRELCRLLPSEPGMRLNLGISLYSGGRYTEAVTELESLLKHDPSIEPAYLFLGLSRLGAGKAAAAVAPLSRAVEAEPRNVVALLALGDVH